MKAFELVLKARKHELREELALMTAPRDARRLSLSPRFRSSNQVHILLTSPFFGKATSMLIFSWIFVSKRSPDLVVWSRLSAAITCGSPKCL